MVVMLFMMMMTMMTGPGEGLRDPVKNTACLHEVVCRVSILERMIEDHDKPHLKDLLHSMINDARPASVSSDDYLKRLSGGCETYDFHETSPSPPATVPGVQASKLLAHHVKVSEHLQAVARLLDVECVYDNHVKHAERARNMRMLLLFDAFVSTVGPV